MEGERAGLMTAAPTEKLHRSCGLVRSLRLGGWVMSLWDGAVGAADAGVGVAAAAAGGCRVVVGS